MADIVSTLQSHFDAKDILQGSAVADRATSYWDASPTRAKAIVFPRSTQDVSFVLKACHAADQKVVTQGGLTGVVDGCVSTDDAIIISLEKMTVIEEVEPIGGTAIVQAGAVLENVQTHMAEQGMLFPLDLGARGSCTIGGNVATNAGGMNVIRYGMMRNLVLGLEAVLADGTVLSSMNTMLKNNAGYDLKQLFIGTEGTLGIVTRVVLRVFPGLASSNSALVAMESFEAVTKFLQRAQRQLGGNLSAYEVMWGNYYRAVTAEGWQRAPMDRDYPFYVVVQAEGTNPGADEAAFTDLLESALNDGDIVDAILPKSEAETRAIWEVREDFSAILENDPYFLYDVSLPIKDMAAYVKKVEADVATKWPNGACYTLGHIGDGNLHFFVAPGVTAATHGECDAVIYGALAGFAGSISAEHGIGVEKKSWLTTSRSEDEVATMRLLKAALDPKGILNPGVVID
ncbi:MAG: FAD-binding oxidoreductase [Alphaproteobacteria bacterium]